MAELNTLLGRDQMYPKTPKAEKGVTDGGPSDAVSENPHLFRPADYENKIYFSYLLDRLAFLAEKRITHEFNFIGIIIKRCSFVGIYNQHEMIEMQQKKVDMLET